ncbi:hypothetical protein M4951_00465 [Blastopirellula sp. J2-11]|uniref:hypothetical protein n=1 Tax=Blastopirellula sp. J2-11 TaxID=2943192 RepID=UPI0021C9B78E|nr:hypothetical protein [Blastopirellula sp. J2-11]UUO06800.1 hypothetical protein M4951_00465 [Blastopirellula sp. J2-11]
MAEVTFSYPGVGVLELRRSNTEFSIMTTLEQLESFYAFAFQNLHTQPDATSLDELLLRWYDSQRQNEIHAAIRQGLNEMDAGLGRPVSEFFDEFRQINSIPETPE